jgi:hypothetical protein
MIVLVCIFAHVQWRWARIDSLAHGQAEPLLAELGAAASRQAAAAQADTADGVACVETNRFGGPEPKPRPKRGLCCGSPSDRRA